MVLTAVTTYIPRSPRLGHLWKPLNSSVIHNSVYFAWRGGRGGAVGIRDEKYASKQAIPQPPESFNLGGAFFSPPCFFRRAAGAGVRAMTLGADETARLASEGVSPTDDDSKYTWSSTIGSKVWDPAPGQKKYNDFIQKMKGWCKKMCLGTWHLSVFG